MEMFIINRAKIKYEYLNKTFETTTNEITIHKKQILNFKEKLYLPQALPQIHKMNFMDLLTLNVKKNKSVGPSLTINYVINCNYINEFLLSQTYLKNFSRYIELTQPLNLEQINLKIARYSQLTGRLIEINFSLEF